LGVGSVLKNIQPIAAWHPQISFKIIGKKF
jgi:hypothetical protein